MTGVGGVINPTAPFGISALLGLSSSDTFAKLYLWPRLRAMDRERALASLVAPHMFIRFFGLSFLVPGVVSPSLPPGFAIPAAYGDLVAGLLAIAATLALRKRAPGAMLLVWFFNVWGAADLLLGGFHGLRVGLDPGASSVLPPDRSRASPACHASPNIPAFSFSQHDPSRPRKARGHHRPPRTFIAPRCSKPSQPSSDASQTSTGSARGAHPATPAAAARTPSCTACSASSASSPARSRIEQHDSSAPPAPRLNEAVVAARGDNHVVAGHDPDQLGRGPEALRQIGIVR